MTESNTNHLAACTMGQLRSRAEFYCRRALAATNGPATPRRLEKVWEMRVRIDKITQEVEWRQSAPLGGLRPGDANAAKIFDCDDAVVNSWREIRDKLAAA